MKTLDQWLKDSDEEDSEEDVQRNSSQSDARNPSEDPHSSGSRVASVPRTSGTPSLTGSQMSAHTPTTLRPAEHPDGGLYARQEETREKMRRLLGASAVVKATTPTSSSAGHDSPTWPISAPPDRAHFPFGATSNTTQPMAQSLWTPPTLGSAGAPAAVAANTQPSPNSSQLPEVEQTMEGINEISGGGDPAYKAVEVMVVDRGTQTVTSEGTQTEPLPISVGPFYTGPYMPAAYGGFGAIAAYGNYVMPPPSFGLGIDGRPYRQHLYDYEKKEAEEASKLREELGMIQNSIDMLIARYNLPPPPL